MPESFDQNTATCRNDGRRLGMRKRHLSVLCIIGWMRDRDRFNCTKFWCFVYLHITFVQKYKGVVWETIEVVIQCWCCWVAYWPQTGLLLCFLQCTSSSVSWFSSPARVLVFFSALSISLAVLVLDTQLCCHWLWLACSYMKAKADKKNLRRLWCWSPHYEYRLQRKCTNLWSQRRSDNGRGWCAHFIA